MTINLQKSGCKDAAAVQDNRCIGRGASIAIKQERMPALALTKPSIPLWVESQENVFKISAAGVFFSSSEAVSGGFISHLRSLCENFKPTAILLIFWTPPVRPPPHI